MTVWTQMMAFSGAIGILFIASSKEMMNCWLDEKDINARNEEISTNVIPTTSWTIGMHQVQGAGVLCLLLGALHILDAVVTLLTRRDTLPECPQSASDASLYSSSTMIPPLYRHRKPFSLYTPSISGTSRFNRRYTPIF